MAGHATGFVTRAHRGERTRFMSTEITAPAEAFCWPREA
jgi:hypothetical protein